MPLCTGTVAKSYRCFYSNVRCRRQLIVVCVAPLNKKEFVHCQHFCHRSMRWCGAVIFVVAVAITAHCTGAIAKINAVSTTVTATG